MLRSSHADALSLSVVIPVWNGAEHLGACLDALAGSLRKPNEIVVVDDSSDDDSAAIAHAHGCKVVSIKGGPHGPATARNRGVAISSGDVIVFIDSDVVVHADTLAQIEEQFLADPELCAAFGSYDDAPTERGVISGYRNLLHHHVHQQSNREASTFWAGCGAIRREAFVAADGFDETYRWASIEDIELGLRLRAANHRLRLCPEIQATHRKRWTFRQMIHIDVMRRTVPWTKLILRHGSLPNDLNLRREHRVSALAAWLLLFLLIYGIAHPLIAFAAVLPIAILFACNWQLYRLFVRQRGFYFSLGAIGLHWLHYLYTSVAFIAVVVASSLRALSSAHETRSAPRAAIAHE
jgi:glycosyltransferase involved in cell wall biosynthesis